MSLIQKFIAAMVLFTGLALLGVPEAAAQRTSKLTVRTFDDNGKPLGGVPVSIYSGNSGRCACNPQPSPGPLCIIGTISEVMTTDAKHGKAEFTGLIRGNTYTVCINANCTPNQQQCQNPVSDCAFHGTCKTIVVGPGGHENVQFP